MKQQLIIYILLVISSINVVYSQRIVITNDSLRNHFKKESVNEVLSYFIKNYTLSFDFKKLYYDKTLKDSLLKWLDKGVILEYELESYRKIFEERFEQNEEQKISFTRRYIEKDLKLKYDSISSDTTLFKIYTENAIKEFVNNNIKNSFLERKEQLLPPHEVLALHSRIVYPEAYKRIKHWWYLYRNSQEPRASLFECMLRMNDPEAQSVYDRRLKEFIQSKDQVYPYYLAMSSLESIANAYAVRKLLELLPVKRSVKVISGDPPVPHDYIVLSSIIMLCNRYQVKVDSYSPDLIIEIKDFNKYIEYIRGHKKEIVEASQRLIEKLEKEEQYWMENMPFDYIPDLSKE